MAGNSANGKSQPEQVFFLSEIIGSKVILNGKKIGKLTDMIILDGPIAEVKALCVWRPYGYAALLVPWEKVQSWERRRITIDIENVEKYEGEPREDVVLLRDHILDKKVVDIEDREVEVVYDVKLVLRGLKLYVTDVDFSRYGLLRRIGLKGLATFIYKLAERIREQTISWTYIQPIPTTISSFKGDVKLKVLKEKIAEMPPVDVAEILEELDHDQRVRVFNELEPEQASDTLEEIDPNVKRELISSLKKEKVAELIDEMTPGRAAETLAALPSWQAKAILHLLEGDEAEKIVAILEEQEQQILNYASSEFLRFPPDTTATQAREEYHLAAKDKVAIMYVYVVDENDKLLGVIDIKELLQANATDKLKDVMTTNVIALHPESTLAEASETFSRYGFRAIPVTDENDKIIGVVPYRDIANLKKRIVE